MDSSLGRLCVSIDAAIRTFFPRAQQSIRLDVGARAHTKFVNYKEVPFRMANSRNRKLVPECDQAIQQWKYEIAGELGLTVPGSASAAGFQSEMAGELGAVGGASGSYEDWGSMTARDTGSIGGSITRRLVRQAEQSTQQLTTSH